MTLIHFQDHRDNRYHQLPEDTPVRTEDGTLCLLKDARTTTEVEVFMDGVWVKGWLPGEPTIYMFQVECVSYEDEKGVAAVLHDSLIKHHGARESKLPWHKIIPPTKQVRDLGPEAYVVIAREDRQPDGSQGRYTLCTRQIFATEQQAKDYADGVSPSREAIVVPGRFNELRKP